MVSLVEISKICADVCIQLEATVYKPIRSVATVDTTFSPFIFQVNATDNGFTVECFEGLDGAWNGGHIPQYLSYVAELYDSDHAVNMSLGVASVSAATLMKSPAAPMCLANVSVAGTPGNAPLLFVFADVPRAENNEAGYRVYIYAVNRKGRSTVTRVVAHVLNASKYTRT